jgi:hypothetical protein
MSNKPVDISKRTPFDHVINGLKAIAASVPFAGGLASLMEDYVPKSTEKALNQFLDEVNNRLHELVNRVDLESVDEDEFSEHFKSCYLGIIRTTQEDKIKIFAKLFLNIILKEDDEEKVSYSELDHLVRSMDNLSIGALRVLLLAYELAKSYPKGRFNFSELAAQVGDLDAPLIMGLVNELNLVNLVHSTGVPGIREDDYANYPIELTELGIRFVERFAGRSG